jgi:hypothetical protein
MKTEGSHKPHIDMTQTTQGPSSVSIDSFLYI